MRGGWCRIRKTSMRGNRGESAGRWCHRCWIRSSSSSRQRLQIHFMRWYTRTCNAKAIHMFRTARSDGYDYHAVKNEHGKLAELELRAYKENGIGLREKERERNHESLDRMDTKERRKRTVIKGSSSHRQKIAETQQKLHLT
jgi:hypothetical protein